MRMKQNQTDKYCVAWFNIADYVLRGERERALGVYKLLAHSINDPALALQVEGDILWAFNDSDALEKYLSAAELYVNHKRFDKAIALYQQILLLNPEHECKSLLAELRSMK